jgi:hypothetical protein
MAMTKKDTTIVNGNSGIEGERLKLVVEDDALEEA